MQNLLNLQNLPISLAVSIQFVTFFSVFLLITFFKNFILKKAQAKLSESPNIWDDAVVSAAIWPTNVLIWLLFTSYFFKLIANSYPEYIMFADANHYIKSIGVIVILAWFAMALISKLEFNYFRAIDKDTTLDSASSYLLGKIVRAAIFAIALIMILQTLGYSLTALLTVGGAGSIVIGLAAKDMLANFFGGLMVYLDKPFKVGDWIKAYSSQNLEGTVEKIGWRTTRLRNFDKRPVYVPNNIWSSVPVENATRMINRRVKETIGVRYKDADKLKKILSDIEAMLQEHEGIDRRQNIIVRFTEFGSSSLNFMLYFFTKATKLKDFSAIKEDIFFKIIEIVRNNGADFAFPTTTLDLPISMVTQLSKNQ